MGLCRVLRFAFSDVGGALADHCDPIGAPARAEALRRSLAGRTSDPRSTPEGVLLFGVSNILVFRTAPGAVVLSAERLRARALREPP